MYCFCRIDKDRNGRITADELQQALSNGNLGSSACVEHELLKIFCFNFFNWEIKCIRDGSLFRGARADANGGRPCSNSPDPSLCEAHFLLTLTPLPNFV